MHELDARLERIAGQVVDASFPVLYDEIRLDAGYRNDLLVQDEVVLELKAVDDLLPIHTAQLLTYLKLSGRELGFLINFNSVLIKDGIKRKVLTK